MILTALLSFAVRTYFARHGEPHRTTPEQLRSGMAVDLTLALLFGIALLIAVMFPRIGYLSMPVMFANPFVQRVFERVLPLPHSRPRRDEKKPLPKQGLFVLFNWRRRGDLNPRSS